TIDGEVTLQGWITIDGLRNPWDDFSGTPPTLTFGRRGKIIYDNGVKLRIHADKQTITPYLGLGIHKSIDPTVDFIDLSAIGIGQGEQNIQGQYLQCQYNSSGGWNTYYFKITLEPEQFDFVQFIVEPIFGGDWSVLAGKAAGSNYRNKTWKGICCDENNLYAISYDGTVLIRSIDNEEWQKWGGESAKTATEAAELTGSGSCEWGSAMFCNGKFYTIDYYTGIVVSSENGVDWDTWARPDAYEGGGWADICSDGSGIYAVNCNLRRIMYSQDGESWTTITSTNDSEEKRIAYYNRNLYIINNYSGLVLVKDLDFEQSLWTWGTASPLSNNWESWTDICFDENGKLYAFRRDLGILASSYDGKAWDVSSATTANSFYNLCYNNGKFYSISNNNVGTTAVFTVSDSSIQFGFGDSSTHHITERSIFHKQLSSKNATIYTQNAQIIWTEIKGVQIGNLHDDAKLDCLTGTALNRSGYTITLQIGNDEILSDEIKLDLYPNAILPNFVADSRTLAVGKTLVGVCANLTPLPGSKDKVPLVLEGNWSQFKDAPFETSGSGTLQIASSASMPQSDMTIGGESGELVNLELGSNAITTGAGKTVTFRPGTTISGTGSLKVGAGGRIVF
ncbi:MAG: hypothetical protein LBL99_03585, partial [Holosporaceae bacterium]|nr:hypothetical protein [Holosporaceae bacterium]